MNEINRQPEEIWIVIYNYLRSSHLIDNIYLQKNEFHLGYFDFRNRTPWETFADNRVKSGGRTTRTRLSRCTQGSLDGAKASI